MKKPFTLLTIAMFMVSSSIANAQYGQTHTKVSTSKKVVHTKKNGTPDMRYKDNAHLKANGTPDKRYKENKTTSTSTKTATHVKADGTPDMKHKENKKTTTTTTTRKSKM